MGLISGLYMSRRGWCTPSTGPPKTIILIFANPTYNRLQHLILLQLQVNVFYKDCLGCDLVKILHMLSSQVGPFVDGPLSKRNTYCFFFFLVKDFVEVDHVFYIWSTKPWFWLLILKELFYGAYIFVLVIYELFRFMYRRLNIQDLNN